MEGLIALGRDGVMRAGINLGNKALVRDNGGNLTGPAPDLARALAARAGLQLQVVTFPAARLLAEAAPEDRWDVAFLADDPARAHLVACSRPYLTIEATFAYRRGAAITDPAAANRTGVTILTVNGAAFDGPLRALMAHPTFVAANSPTDAVDRFIAGEGDLVAGVRETLQARLAGQADTEIMTDGFATVDQCIAVARHRADQVSLLNQFLDARPERN
jgi:polar amino acid transport system substrate-binding protein